MSFQTPLCIGLLCYTLVSTIPVQMPTSDSRTHSHINHCCESTEGSGHPFWRRWSYIWPASHFSISKCYGATLLTQASTHKVYGSDLALGSGFLTSLPACPILCGSELCTLLLSSESPLNSVHNELVDNNKSIFAQTHTFSYWSELWWAQYLG